MTSSYLVNEIYPCLQGEGIHAGVPSILVRFQICNLRCTWCDTPYTHTFKSDPKNTAEAAGAQNFTRRDKKEICEEIQKHSPISHVIFSGGEPTLQNFIPIIDLLPSYFTAEVETNGTRIPHLQLPGFQKEDYQKAQWNVSPKGNAAGQKLVPEALHHWSAVAKTARVFFKFVCRVEEQFLQNDLEEIYGIIATFGIDAERVILMPEGTSPGSQVGRRDLHDVCIKKGFRLCLRQHVLLFGNERKR